MSRMKRWLFGNEPDDAPPMPYGVISLGDDDLPDASWADSDRLRFVASEIERTLRYN